MLLFYLCLFCGVFFCCCCLGVFCCFFVWLGFFGVDFFVCLSCAFTGGSLFAFVFVFGFLFGGIFSPIGKSVTAMTRGEA